MGHVGIAAAVGMRNRKMTAVGGAVWHSGVIIRTRHRLMKHGGVCE
ncbi:hypothetical protein BBIA_1887 [Bifidobacterium biavatii DSM 23969]|uniref:Uncharacterized protein n=1 Tax=Bifidobacterium biavatii DSM 23969 TaxID=1437608 RepID=A0A086ZSF0_9BIFI|nr:hypothetical protein BBIA_1887 [Bifidobacterium biavatii DSM 23969]